MQRGSSSMDSEPSERLARVGLKVGPSGSEGWPEWV